MDERWGVRGTVAGNVFFTEASLAGRQLGRVQVRIGRQNSHLGEVKRRLATEVVRLGGNALCDFTYGQSARKWWKIGWDEEDWHGAGMAMYMPEASEA